MNSNFLVTHPAHQVVNPKSVLGIDSQPSTRQLGIPGEILSLAQNDTVGFKRHLQQADPKLPAVADRSGVI